MSITTLIIFISLGLILTFIIINHILNLKNNILSLKFELRREKNLNNLYENTINELREEKTILLREYEILNRKNLYIGSTFFYPVKHNINDELIGKRGKIIGIDNIIIKTKLIDLDGNFINDKVYFCTHKAALSYLYEEKQNLYFKFK
jgi:hypothetical protein